MSLRKIVNFYYSTTDTKNKTVYRCLYDGLYDIKETYALDYKTKKNYRMNSNYEATDEDLFKFRDDLHEHNDEIKQIFFKNKAKTVFKVDVFNFNTINDAIYNNIIINSDQQIINAIPDVNFREFFMFENCLSCGLISVDKNILEKPIQSYGYDFSKYYYYMMKKIRIPRSKPEFYVIDNLDFNDLDFGYYRVKIICSNKTFWNVFQFNDKHHYSHNTLKTLYKFKDRYNIEFKLLPPDECYDYNMVWYEHTVELKVLFREWFKVMDKLLKECSKDNWLLKCYISMAWGTLCKYNKTYVNKEECDTYDFDHLNKITSKQYKYYSYKYSNDVYTLIDSNKPFTHGGLGRIKPFLTEYSRNFIFNMVSEHNLESHVIRIQTDGIAFNKPIDFPSLKLAYFPIPEKKSTGHIVFYDVNYYRYVCNHCKGEFKYNKDKKDENGIKNPYICSECGYDNVPNKN